MDVFKLYATDEDLEVAGVEVELSGGAFITVGRENNDNYLVRINEEGLKHQEALNAGGPSARELDRKVTAGVLAETVFLGMRGIKLNDVYVEDTYENRVKLLSKGFKDFRRLVMAEARKIDHFRAKAEAKDLKD